jgi:bla regulator protein BlaR1
MNWLENVLSPALVRALGWTIVHSLWQGAVVGLALVGLLLVLRRHSAQVRYNVACVALATMLGLALVTFVRHYSIALTAAPVNSVAGALIVAAPAAASTDLLPSYAAPAETVTTSGVQAWLQYFDHSLPLIVTAWLLGLLAMTLRMLGGLAYVQRLRHYRVQPLAAPWNERLAVLAAKAGLKRSITLLESALVKAPLVAGHLKPIILLPLGTVMGLTQSQLEAILAHELAHIARRDYLMNIVQSVAEILFFYHPAVWFITACLRTERENCCDDEATAICGDPLTLARALAALAEMGHDVTPVPQLALSAVGPDGSLLGRIRRLVQRRAAPTFSEGVMAALVVMGGLVLLGLTAAVSMASPRPWTAKAKALAGLVTGSDNTLWVHSLETMHPDTLPTLLAPQNPSLTQDDDKDKKKTKYKNKDGNKRVVIVRDEQLGGPGRPYGDHRGWPPHRPAGRKQESKRWQHRNYPAGPAGPRRQPPQPGRRLCVQLPGQRRNLRHDFQGPRSPAHGFPRLQHEHQPGRGQNQPQHPARGQPGVGFHQRRPRGNPQRAERAAYRYR